MRLKGRRGGAQKERVTKCNGGKWEDEGKKMERGQGEGSQESKGESGKEDKGRNERGEVRRAGLKQRSILLFFPHHFSSSFSITHHPDRAGNWPWTCLSLSFLLLFLCLSLPRGSAPQREPWGPEIADDKIAAAFHSAEGYPTLP